MVHKSSHDYRGVEKYILRKAFDTAETETETAYLPQHILWRQKEQFSDGVGYAWIDALRDYAENTVSKSIENFADEFPYNTPRTKEAYLYRDIFRDHFPSDHAASTVPYEKSIACSTERALKWDASFKGKADPSGRSAPSHSSHSHSHANETGFC